MTEREMLELAAKAGGEDVEWHDSGSYFYRKSCNWPAEKGFFNPLHDDGECFRLEDALDIGIVREPYRVSAVVSEFSAYEWYASHESKSAARRMASTRLAAEIGKNMP